MKPQGKLSRTIGAISEIQTRKLPDTKQRCYCLSQPDPAISNFNFANYPKYSDIGLHRNFGTVAPNYTVSHPQTTPNFIHSSSCCRCDIGIIMHQGAFMGANWTVRRKLSVAPHPRRGYQPHGAHWNVQVVRSRVTKRCLWNACKALTLGVVLLLAGCTMATVGKYGILLVRRSFQKFCTLRLSGQ